MKTEKVKGSGMLIGSRLKLRKQEENEKRNIISLEFYSNSSSASVGNHYAGFLL